MDGGGGLAVLDLAGDADGLVDGDGEALAAEAWKAKPADAAVSMPMTWPLVSTRAPPESPGWMSAFTWIRPVSCSLVPSPSSVAVMDWSRAVTVPPALLGVPPTPPALPRPTTPSPTDTWEELPMVAVRRPLAPLQLDQGDVVGPVVADHRAGVGLAVADVGRPDARGARDDVVVGEHQAVGGEHDPGAGASPPSIAEIGVDVDEVGARPWRRWRWCCSAAGRPSPTRPRPGAVAAEGVLPEAGAVGPAPPEPLPTAVGPDRQTLWPSPSPTRTATASRRMVMAPGRLRRGRGDHRPASRCVPPAPRATRRRRRGRREPWPPPDQLSDHVSGPPPGGPRRG